MRIRKGKNYTVVIFGFRNLAVLTRVTSNWALNIQQIATCGVTMYDCTFREAVKNLKICKSRGFHIQINKGL